MSGSTLWILIIGIVIWQVAAVADRQKHLQKQKRRKKAQVMQKASPQVIKESAYAKKTDQKEVRRRFEPSVKKKMEKVAAETKKNLSRQVKPQIEGEDVFVEDYQPRYKTMKRSRYADRNICIEVEDIAANSTEVESPVRISSKDAINGIVWQNILNRII